MEGQTRAGVLLRFLGVDVAEVRGAVVGMEPLLSGWISPGMIIQDPAAPELLAVELPRTQKGLSCFLRAEPL